MRLFRLALIALLAILTLACSKVNMENYSRLKVGQNYDEVVAILGPPTHCNEILGVRQCLWGDEVRNVKAGFIGDTVLTLTATNLK